MNTAPDSVTYGICGLVYDYNSISQYLWIVC